MDQPIYFRNMASFADFDEFDFHGDLIQQEIDILQPQIEAQGYTKCQWGPGESANFGPFTRVCKAENEAGTIIHFVYNVPNI